MWTAIENGAEIVMLIVAPSLLASDGATALVERQAESGVRVVRVSDEVFESLSDRDGPAGLGAVVRPRWSSLDDLELGPTALIVAIEESGNPGNLGTIVRTADAVAASGVAVVGGSTDPFDPAAVKASMGTVFAIPLCKVSDTAALFAWATDRGISAITTSAHARDDLWSVDYPAPAVVLFGSEAHGLSPEDIARGDVAVRIPMGGAVSSLNLGVAAGILLYEMARRRVGANRGEP